MSKNETGGGIDRRGEAVAAVGAALSLAFALLLCLLALWSQNSAASLWMASFQLVGCVGIWLLCYVQLHQRRLLIEEKLEVADLERMRREQLGGAESIFREEDLEQMDALAMGRRLRSIERFLIPIVALCVAAFHVAAGLSVFDWAGQFPMFESTAKATQVVNREMLMFFAGGLSFVTFMLSRYALGMSRLAPFAALRAGGNYMFGSSVVQLGIALALLAEVANLARVEPILAVIIGVLLCVLSVETIAGYILSFYRPRLPGAEQRPFYDSRLLGIFSEPEGIIKSVANTLDYQFGFKVSETWFYQLMGRAILPLLLVQLIVLLALTCFVVVPPGHQAVIERFGEAQPETAKAGIHVMYPWPIDRATVIPTDRIQRMVLGFERSALEDAAEARKADTPTEQLPPILWTKKHREKEYRLLVAHRASSQAGEDRISQMPVNLLSVEMPVQWRVKPGDREVIKFHEQSADVGAIIESLAYRELTRYAASADLSDFLGMGGVAAAETIRRNLQSACDAAGWSGQGLGVEIVYVGIGGVHPPPDEEVAQSYQDVVSALEKKDAEIKKAEGEATKLLVETAGTHWQELIDAINAEETARRAAAPGAAEKTLAVERLFNSATGGQARYRVATAAHRAYARHFSEKAAAERYSMQLDAYESARHTYSLRMFLRMMADSLKGVRKYVIAMRDSSKVLYELDLKGPAELDAVSAEIATKEVKQ